MRQTAKHSAYIILLTFVVGSIFAPASHYVYMMFSDLYGVGNHMDHGSGHHEHVMLHAHLNDAGESHFECEYAALFATFVATGTAAASSLDIEPIRLNHVEAPVQAPISPQKSPFHQRGPPAIV